MLHALVDLHEVTGDVKYLAEAAWRGDRLLAHRDDRRGVRDGSGQSRPAWSMASKYVVAEGSLADATGQPRVALRSTLSAYNISVWKYWYDPVTTTGWTPANSPSLNIPNLPATAIVEDTPHGVLDIALVVSAPKSGVVFDDRDRRRFAITLLVNVLNPERTNLWRRVDGSGGEYPDYFPALFGWLELSAADPAVYYEIRRTVTGHAPENLNVITALLKWEKRLER